MPGGFRIWQDCKYARVTQGAEICLNKPKYALIMSQYVLICINNAEYDRTCRDIPEKTKY